jgi:hypothetical protein
MATSNSMTVIVNTLLFGKTATVEIEHENVMHYSIGQYNGVLRVTHEDGSETVYAQGIWRDFDWNPRSTS